MNIKVLPYKAGSKSAKSLAQGLGALRMLPVGSEIRDSSTLTIINWGNTSTDLDRFIEARIINEQLYVANCVDKASFFRIIQAAGGLEKPRTPEAYYSYEEAVTNHDFDQHGALVCRTILNGHSGAGIVIANNRDEVVDAPLYTRYIKKSQEYRVHVGFGEAFFIQRKARNLEVPDDQVNWKIRNHANGFIFAHNEDAGAPPDVVAQAMLAINAMGLDFGAVDIAYNDHHDQAYVLEVNTACGLEGSTVDAYVNMFRRNLGQELRPAICVGDLVRVTYNVDLEGESDEGPGFYSDMSHLYGETFGVREAGRYLSIQDHNGRYWDLLEEWVTPLLGTQQPRNRAYSLGLPHQARAAVVSFLEQQVGCSLEDLAQVSDNVFTFERGGVKCTLTV